MGYILRAGSESIEVSDHTNALAVYNVLVDVIRLTNTNTALGHTESEDTLFSNMPCAIRWKSGSEKILFNKSTHYLDAVLRCRKRDITTKDRIRLDGSDYEIVDLYDYNNLGRLLVIGLRKIG